MKGNLQFLTQALSGQPWAVTPQTLEHLQQLAASGKALAGADEQVTPEATVQKVPLIKANGRSVGVVTFHGVVINRCPDWATYSGYMSPQTFAREIRALADDPMTTSIVISVDSPGGTVAGTVEAAEAVAYARSKKRVTAVVNDTACSAAYWVASQASEIVVSPTSVTGSIGCIISHADYTKMASDWGITFTYIRSALKKALGQPYEPLSDAARQEFQDMVDAVHTQFTAAVAKGRRKARSLVAEQWATGEVWTGSEAITAGLADRLGTLSTVISEQTGAILPPEPSTPAPDDEEADDPDALGTPPPAATSAPPAATEQNPSPTDDPPPTPEAGSSIPPSPAPHAQEDRMTIAAISAKLAAGDALTAEERRFLDDHLNAQTTGQPAAQVDPSALSPEVKALLDQANARAEQAERTANIERDTRLNREFSEKAVALGQPAAFGATLREASEKLSPEAYQALEQSLNATRAQQQLVTETGSSKDARQAGSPQAEYERRVAAHLKEHPAAHRADAGRAVLAADPEFARRYRG